MGNELRKKLKPFAYVHWVASGGMYRPSLSFENNKHPKNTAFTENLYEEEIVHEMFEVLEEVCRDRRESGCDEVCSICRVYKSLSKARGEE